MEMQSHLRSDVTGPWRLLGDGAARTSGSPEADRSCGRPPCNSHLQCCTSAPPHTSHHLTPQQHLTPHTTSHHLTPHTSHHLTPHTTSHYHLTPAHTSSHLTPPSLTLSTADGLQDQRHDDESKYHLEAGWGVFSQIVNWGFPSLILMETSINRGKKLIEPFLDPWHFLEKLMEIIK